MLPASGGSARTLLTAAQVNTGGAAGFPDILPVKDKDYYGEQYVAPSPFVLSVNLCPVLDPGEQALDKVGPLVEQLGGQWTSNI